MGSLGEWNNMETEKIQRQRDENIYTHNGNNDDDGQMIDLEIENEEEEFSDQQQKDQEGKISVSQQQQYVCEYDSCKKVFRAKKSLRDHLRIHTNQRPYHCREQNCGKSFVQYSSLQKHLRIHKGDRPYKCTIEGCEQSFTQVSNLNRHLSLHQNIKPYVCDICQRTFATISNLHQHKITHETSSERARFICEIDSCGKSYLYQSSLKKHEKEHILNNLQQTYQKQQQTISDFNQTQVVPGILLTTKDVQLTHNNYDEMQNYYLFDNNPKNNVNSMEKVNDWQSNLFFQQQIGQVFQHNYTDLNQEVNIIQHQIVQNHGLKQPFSQESQQLSAADSINNNNYANNKTHNQLSGQHLAIPNMDINSIPVQKESQTQDMSFLSSFFDNSHVALQHGDHYDILFKGYLYNYNKKTGKVEIHDIEIQDEVQKGTCQPLSEMSHNSNEEMHKKLSEIEYRYNDASIFTSACSSLSCKCALNPDRYCCQGQQNEGDTDQMSVSTQCCCADKEKEAVDKEKLLEKQEMIMKQENGQKGCCKMKTKVEIVKDDGNCCKKDKKEVLDDQNQGKKGEEKGKCCGSGNSKKQEINIDEKLSSKEKENGEKPNNNQQEDQKSRGCCCKGNEISQEKKESTCCSSDKQIEKKSFEKNGCCSKKNNINEQPSIQDKETQNLISQSSCCSKSQSTCNMADSIKQECTCTDCGDNCSADCKNCNAKSNSKIQEQDIMQNQMKIKEQQQKQEIGLQQQKQQQQNISNDPAIQRCICQETKDLKHIHGVNCGHLAVFHNGHLDYIVDNKLHHPHGTHCDYHGRVEVLENTLSI